MKTRILFLFGFLLSVQIFSQNLYSVKSISTTEWIDGDLYSPQNDIKNSPLVIVIPGSGPTDRDGNHAMGKSNSYKFLAQRLAENGISVFTFDKKFFKQIAAGKFNQQDLTFDDGVNDVVEIIEFFKKKNPEKEIYLLGHSEGSLVGILAAQKENIKGFISVAGAGKPINEILTTQISKQAPFLKDETIRVLEELKKGNKVEDFNPMLATLFGPEIQPYMISWVKYNPKEEIEKLKIPILIVQGTKDIQVEVENAELLHQGAPHSEMAIIENLNHVLKEIEGGEVENMESYNQPDLPISENLVQTIPKFIKSQYGISNPNF